MLQEEKLDLVRLQMEQAESVRRHYQTKEVAVWIPLLQSLVFVAAPVTVLTSVGVASAAYFKIIHLDLVSSSLIIFAAFVLSFWWNGKARVENWNSLIWNLEERINFDVSGDGQVGAPKVLKVHISDRRGHQQFMDLYGSEQAIISLLHAMLNGESLAEDDWQGTGKPFHGQDLDKNREALIEKGFAEWVNETNIRLGWRGTEDGKIWIQEMINQGQIPPPPPRQYNVTTLPVRTYARHGRSN